MGLELIFFISAILFGIFIYWRESNSNKAYRFFNKILNSKELQMKPDNTKGFVYKQKAVLRVIYCALFFVFVVLVLRFLIPIEFSYVTISVFTSIVFGTVLGTYLATFVLKSTKIVEEKSDDIEDFVTTTIEKSKAFIEDITEDNENNITSAKAEQTEKIEQPQKSARQRLKDKGLM